MGSSLPKQYPSKKHKSSPQCPEGRNVSSNTKIYPEEITYDNLKKGIIFSFHNIYYEIWKTSEAKTYLSSIGVSLKYVEEIISYTKACRNIMEYEAALAGISFPVSWNSDYKLDQYIDAPMHLLCLGIVKSIIALTMEWMNGFGEYKQLGKIIDPIVASIHDMNLDWCEILCLNECDQKYNPKGWVSENYLGFSRIISILYNPVRMLMEKKDGISVNNFEGMIITLHVMLCMLFAEKHTEHLALDSIIKIF